MKKLGRVSIKNEKILSDIELLNIKGGDMAVYDCWVGLPGGQTIDSNFSFSSTSGLIAATAECGYFYNQYFSGSFCVCD